MKIFVVEESLETFGEIDGYTIYKVTNEFDQTSMLDSEHSDKG